MLKLAHILLVTAAALAFPAAVSAQIYHYIGQDGTSIYTTEPIAGVEPEQVIGGGSNGASSSSSGEARASSPNPNPDRDPTIFDTYIREAAEAYSVPFEFIKAVIRVESAFDPHAVSHAGAIGLMQLMPATAESLNCADPFDPQSNIMAGTQYLRLLINRYGGDINLVLAAYNAGPGAVGRYDGIPYEATRRYVERVFQYYNEYLEGAGEPAQ